MDLFDLCLWTSAQNDWCLTGELHGVRMRHCLSLKSGMTCITSWFLIFGVTQHISPFQSDSLSLHGFRIARILAKRMTSVENCVKVALSGTRRNLMLLSWFGCIRECLLHVTFQIFVGLHGTLKSRMSVNARISEHCKWKHCRRSGVSDIPLVSIDTCQTVICSEHPNLCIADFIFPW